MVTKFGWGLPPLVAIGFTSEGVGEQLSKAPCILVHTATGDLPLHVVVEVFNLGFDSGKMLSINSEYLSRMCYTYRPTNLLQAKCTCHQLLNVDQSELLQTLHHTVHHCTVVRKRYCTCLTVFLLRAIFPPKPRGATLHACLCQMQFLPCFAKLLKLHRQSQHHCKASKDS